MTDSLAISTTLESLDQYISDMNTRSASSVTTLTACTPFINPYYPDTSFYLYSWSGSTAYAGACMPIYKPWDGQVENFPSFIVNICIRTNKVKRNAAAPHRILSIPTGSNTNCDILTEYQQISSANIKYKFTDHTENCAIQNAKALYVMLSKSVTGTIRDTVFENSQNLPTDKDSISLFNIWMSLTVFASLQISTFYFNKIPNHLPMIYDYAIPKINTELTHLLLLTSTTTCILDNSEHTQNTLTVYDRIKQPYLWYTWVLTKTNYFEYGAIAIYKYFMNQAAIKYENISAAQEGTFTGSKKTITEDIFSIIYDSNHRQRAPSQTTRKQCSPETIQSDNQSQA